MSILDYKEGRGDYYLERTDHQRLTRLCQQLAKTMSKSGDLLGATWKELRAIEREARRRLA